MAEEDDASKTEEPTEKKLAEAKRKGQVAQSQEIKSWAILLGGAIMLLFMAPRMANDIRIIARPFIEKPHEVVFNFNELREVLIHLSQEVLIVLLPLMGALVIIAIAANIGQFGLTFSSEKVKPDISKIGLLKGLQKMFSSKSMFEFLKGILKLALVSTVAFGLAVPMLGDVQLIPSMDFVFSLHRIHEVAVMLVLSTVGVMTVLAFLDFVYQRHTYMKQMRMTKQEVKDEAKQQEGDPQVKSRIRSIRMQRARERMMQAVKDADVVITNPTHYAVALKYDIGEMNAPVCIAKGVDYMALNIRREAEEHDVPIVENPPLARALYATVELDEEIPTEHFKAVAEVIGFIMRQRGDIPVH
ncbi:MAG: flagellar biosynthesis protein FlhB [Rhodospirillaceae bacterium]